MVAWRASGATSARETGSSSRSSLLLSNQNGYGAPQRKRLSGSPAFSEANSSLAGRRRRDPLLGHRLAPGRQVRRARRVAFRRNLAVNPATYKGNPDGRNPRKI